MGFVLVIADGAGMELRTFKPEAGAISLIWDACWYVFIGTRLRILLNEKGHKSRKPATLQRPYENILGAFFRSSRIRIIQRMT
jgi:hypothetical protein